MKLFALSFLLFRPGWSQRFCTSFFCFDSIHTGAVCILPVASRQKAESTARGFVSFVVLKICVRVVNIWWSELFVGMPSPCIFILFFPEEASFGSGLIRLRCGVDIEARRFYIRVSFPTEERRGGTVVCMVRNFQLPVCHLPTTIHSFVR